jgi:hypothetical protein
MEWKKILIGFVFLCFLPICVKAITMTDEAEVVGGSKGVFINQNEDRVLNTDYRYVYYYSINSSNLLTLQWKYSPYLPDILNWLHYSSVIANYDLTKVVVAHGTAGDLKLSYRIIKFDIADSGFSTSSLLLTPLDIFDYPPALAFLHNFSRIIVVEGAKQYYGWTYWDKNMTIWLLDWNLNVLDKVYWNKPGYFALLASIPEKDDFTLCSVDVCRFYDTSTGNINLITEIPLSFQYADKRIEDLTIVGTSGATIHIFKNYTEVNNYTRQFLYYGRYYALDGYKIDDDNYRLLAGARGGVDVFNYKVSTNELTRISNTDWDEYGVSIIRYTPQTFFVHNTYSPFTQRYINPAGQIINLTTPIIQKIPFGMMASYVTMRQNPNKMPYLLEENKWLVVIRQSMEIWKLPCECGNWTIQCVGRDLVSSRTCNPEGCFIDTQISYNDNSCIIPCKVCDTSQMPNNFVWYPIKGICLGANLIVCQPTAVFFTIIFLIFLVGLVYYKIKGVSI